MLRFLNSSICIIILILKNIITKTDRRSVKRSNIKAEKVYKGLNLYCFFNIKHLITSHVFPGVIVNA